MATFRKISNGLEMDGCALYEYLLTNKGYCCEKGWLWEDIDTQMTMTGRDWVVYWAENGSPCTPVCVPPTNTITPIINGRPQEGELLSLIDTGGWDGTEPIVYTYQWHNENGEIAGETNGTYTTTANDVGVLVWCVVIATNDCGQDQRASNTIGPIT